VRRTWRLALAALCVLAAGCGTVERVREAPVVVPNDQTSAPAPQALSPNGEAVRIAVVTHGQASSPFWAIVRNGAEAAGRQMDVVVDYRAPDIYNLELQKQMIAQAIASRPNGMVVSMPEPGVMPVIRQAVRAGIPVITINSGSDVASKLGVLAHVGQPEEQAGFGAGRRLAQAGVRHLLCLNHQLGNQGLDARCAGLARAMRDAGGTSLVLAIDDQDQATTIRRITAALRGGRIDGLIALNGGGAVEAVQASEASGRKDVKVAGFDLTPDVLEAIQRGQMLFTVDQQAYLQGYLPVVLLAERARFGLFPSTRGGGLIPTGPNFVTKENAAKVLELSKRSIR
jgi:simple sugar transport system substrate-binding protein